MRLDTQLYSWASDEPEGTVEWGSETGTLGGTLTPEIRRAVEEAQAAGKVPAGPQFAYSYPADDPLHRPGQFAALLAVMGFRLNRPALAELAATYRPDFPIQKYDPDVTN